MRTGKLPILLSAILWLCLNMLPSAQACPVTYNPYQQDADSDGMGDACDPDDDNDGTPDVSDGCPLDPNNIAPGICGFGVLDCNAGTISGNTSFCTFGGPFSSQLSVSGASGPGTWNSSNTGFATVDANGLVTRTYPLPTQGGTFIISYTVTDGQCTSTATITMTVYNSPSSLVTSTPYNACVNSNVAISVPDAGAGATYQWSGVTGPTNANPTFSNSGIPGFKSYSVTVTAASGCSNTGFGSHINNPLPDATITATPNPACFGPIISLSVPVQASATVSWSGPGINNTTGFSTTASPPGTGIQTYMATVTYNAYFGNCSNTGTATVTVNATPNAAIAVTENNLIYNPYTNIAYHNASYTDGILCTGPNAPTPSTSATLTASGGGTYLWSTGATSPAITVSTAGTYTVVVTGAGGCTASASRTISVNSAPSPGTISATPNLPSPHGLGLCENATITLSSTVPGGVWVANPNNQQVVSTDPVTGLTIPLYNSFSVDTQTVFYRVTLNGCTGTTQRAVEVLNAPNAGTISGTTTICAGTTTQLSSNGTPNGTWSSSNMTAATVNASSGLVTGQSGGTATISYTVTLGSCNSTTTALVTVNAAPNAGGISGTTTVCSGLSTQLTSNGDAGGTWGSGNPAAATVNPSSGLVSGVAGGTSVITYTVTSGNCSSSTNVIVTVNTSPNANISVTETSGTTNNDGIICSGDAAQLNASGGGTYLWSAAGAPTAASIVVLPPTTTTFTVTVTNALSCSATATQTVTVISCDTDGDGIPDVNDNCPSVANASQHDSDNDGLGDACDPDDDNDGVADEVDNCPLTPNPNQANNDGDALGDVCDPDDDNDGTPDATDGCPLDPNKSAPGICGCGVPDTDSDNDGTPDCEDGCPTDPDKTEPGLCGCGNPEDNTDSDGDGFTNCIDHCPTVPSNRNTDSDCDGKGNVCDVCPGGDDNVDNNNDGLPDCKYPPAFAQIIAAWKCGPTLNKVRVCHNGTATQCVTYANLAAHIAHGDYLGPCGNANCNGNRAEAPIKLTASLYPNPANSEVWIDLTEYKGLTCMVRIFNMNGGVVFESHSEAYNEMLRVDVSAMAAGMYFVYVQQDGQAPEVLKLTVVNNN